MRTKISVLSLATASILFASKAQSCLYYYAISDAYECPMTAYIYDNGVKTCWLDNQCFDSGGLYRFTCIAANFAAIAGNFGATVQYATPWGNFAFAPSYFYQGQNIVWEAEEYGC